MTVPTAEFEACSSGAPPVISTTSVSWPTSSVSGIRLALPTCTVMSRRSRVRNPLSVAFRV